MSILFFSCKKKICDANTNGRIIGYDPCRHYYSGRPIYGSGFVIEIDNGTPKDTVVTYQIPDNLFEFKDSYIDGYSSFLFRPQVQDMFKIKLSYRYAADNEKTIYASACLAPTGYFDAATRGKEIFISCITKQ